MEKPPLQHPREVGPLVHVDVGAEAVVTAALVGKTAVDELELVSLCHEAEILAEVAPLLGTV